MAASSPLSSQGGLGVSSNIEGCTRFPSAIDEVGENSQRINKPPSQTVKGTSNIPDRGPINLEAPEADLNLALKFLAFMKSNSGAAIPVSTSAWGSPS